MKRISKLRVLGITLVVLGVLCTLPSQFMLAQQQRAVASQPKLNVPTVAAAPAPSSTLVVGHPTRLSIPSLGIDLPVLNGAYNPDNGTWTISQKDTYFALPSILPNNESGNTLIYGHNNKYVFSKLNKITPGAEVKLTTAEGYTFTYVYTSTEAVGQTDVNVLLYEGPSRLTLQTCSGSLMQNRQMFYFSFVRYE